MILRHNVSLLYKNHTKAVDTIGGDGKGKLDRAHSFPDFGVRLGEQEIDRTWEGGAQQVPPIALMKVRRSLCT